MVSVHFQNSGVLPLLLESTKYLLLRPCLVFQDFYGKVNLASRGNGFCFDIIILRPQHSICSDPQLAWTAIGLSPEPSYGALLPPIGYPNRSSGSSWLPGPDCSLNRHYVSEGGPRPWGRHSGYFPFLGYNGAHRFCHVPFVQSWSWYQRYLRLCPDVFFRCFPQPTAWV